MGGCLSRKKRVKQPQIEHADLEDISPEREDVADAIKQKWEKEQNELKTKLVLEDSDVVKTIRESVDSEDIYYIGGVDISFVKGDNVNACSAFVVVSFPSLQLVYEDYEMIKLTAPYIPGFLAFREADFVVQQYNKLKRTQPQLLPQVLFVDGNGILHPKGFGLASHLGVLLDIAALGVAKKLFQVDGLEKDANHAAKIKELQNGGDTFPLVGKSGKTLGVAMRSCKNSTNPIYVSPGHKICLDTASWLVHKCCKYRIPEPTRLADINSREFLRVNFKPTETEASTSNTKS